MNSDKSYHLYIQPYLKAFIFGMFTVFTGVSLLIAAGVFQSSDGNGPPRIVGLLWLIIISGNGYWVLTIPHTIIVSESGQVVFKSALRMRRTTFREINSIKPYGAQIGFFQIQTNTGKIRLINQVDGFHDFVSRLKEANPTVELKGC